MYVYKFTYFIFISYIYIHIYIHINPNRFPRSDICSLSKMDLDICLIDFPDAASVIRITAQVFLLAINTARIDIPDN